MDSAVKLVEAYLQINGYFTVAEYPVIESTGKHHYRTTTDLDILAFRFPGAGRIVKSSKAGASTIFAPDPAPGIEGNISDMLIGEIKEGRAELNPNTRNPSVITTALARFGCCSIEDSESTVQQLIRKGEAMTHRNHRVRLLASGFWLLASGFWLLAFGFWLLAFGSVDTPSRKYRTITMGHIVNFIESYLDEHWEILRTAQFKHPTLGLLMVIKKARANMNTAGI